MITFYRSPDSTYESFNMMSKKKKCSFDNFNFFAYWVQSLIDLSEATDGKGHEELSFHTRPPGGRKMMKWLGDVV